MKIRPTYGNRNKFITTKKSDISKGDVANDTTIQTTVHIGTHIDICLIIFLKMDRLLKIFDCDILVLISYFYRIPPSQRTHHQHEL